MKKITSIFLTILILGVLAPFQAQAAISPRSSFYFLQEWGETIGLLFSFSKEAKVNYLIQLTDRRAEEISENSSEFSKEEMERITMRYENHFTKLEAISGEEIKNKEEVSGRIKDANLQQQQLLATAYSTVAEGNEQLLTNVQNRTANTVSRVIREVEGQSAASNYLEVVRQIQQVQVRERAQKVQMEMESQQGGGLENQLQESKPIQQGQEFNEIQQGGDGGQQGSGQMQQVEPGQMNPQNQQN